MSEQEAKRKGLALIAGLLICFALITPFVLAIKYYDWGVSLLLLAPLLVWLLLHIARLLEGWASGENQSASIDPDFPESDRGDQ